MTRAERLRGVVDDRVAALQEITASAAATPDEIDVVIVSLGDERKAVQRRAAEAAAACVQSLPSVATRLHQVLREGPFHQRWGAAFALSLAGIVELSMLPTLLDALDKTDGDVRWAAADLMKRLAKQETSTVVVALLHAARAGAVNQRKMSLYILRDLQCQDASAVALDGLAAAAIEVRLAALSALVALAQDRAGAAARVVALVDDDDARMRRAAAAALGQLAVATDAVVARLEAATKTDDPSLRRAAEGALLRIGSR